MRNHSSRTPQPGKGVVMNSGSGYVSASAFRALGFVFGLLYLTVFLGIGLPWINFLNPELGSVSH